MTITYSDGSIEHRMDSKAVKRAVATRAIQVRQSAHAGDTLVTVRAEDGIYIYLSQAEADADETGTQAFAVVG